MFNITVETGTVKLQGRFDATQVDRAREALDGVDSTCTVDFGELEYISSAGLGVLLKTQKRLARDGERLRLANLNPHISEIFKIAGFDKVFEIE